MDGSTPLVLISQWGTCSSHQKPVVGGSVRVLVLGRCRHYPQSLLRQWPPTHTKVESTFSARRRWPRHEGPSYSRLRGTKCDPCSPCTLGLVTWYAPGTDQSPSREFRGKSR